MLDKVFLFKYKILKDPENLAKSLEEFYKLSKVNQRKVLDKYFSSLPDNLDLGNIFNNNYSRIYIHNKEVSFFSFYYFDKLFLNYNVYNITYIDRFNLEDEKVEYLLDLFIDNVKKCNFIPTKLVIYPDKLPIRLSSNLKVMDYLISLDYTMVKYITILNDNQTASTYLINKALMMTENKKFDIKDFMLNDGTISNLLLSNFEFILYIIKNDIYNIKYLSRDVMETFTITSKSSLVNEVIKNIDSDEKLVFVLKCEVSEYFSNDVNFIKYMIKIDNSNIKYINFSLLPDFKKNDIVDFFVDNLVIKDFNIMKYSFKDVFLSNYKFMKYLIESDIRWIAVVRVVDKEQINELIKLFLKRVDEINYRFRIKDFLEDGEYINHALIENSNMLKYLFKNCSSVPKYINFFNLENGKAVADGIVKEMGNKDYEFHNEYFLVNGKYPAVLSSSFIFMKFVIDKNFNNLAFIDDKFVSDKDLKKIINYAFRMVYYIRGNNRKLSFDMEGYFKNSTIKDNLYFIECMNSL